MENQNFNTGQQSFNTGQQSFNQGHFNQGQQNIPKAVGVMIVGIVASFSWLIYFIPGIVCGIIALSMAKKANALVAANPGMYKESSIKMVRTGKICGMIGLIIGSVCLLIIVVAIIIAVVTDGRGF